MATIVDSSADGRETLVKLKLTPAQAARLWRLLEVESTNHHGPAMTDDLSHADVWDVWV